MSKPHALIIDDKHSNVEVMTMLLDKEGVNYTTLLSPRTLLETLDQLSSLDVVFLDLELPNYNGFEVLQDLRRHPLTTSVPIIAYSVHISELNEARDAGFDGFLSKPLNMSHFPNQLQKIFNHEPVWE